MTQANIQLSSVSQQSVMVCVREQQQHGVGRRHTCSRRRAGRWRLHQALLLQADSQEVPGRQSSVQVSREAASRLAVQALQAHAQSVRSQEGASEILRLRWLASQMPDHPAALAGLSASRTA